MNFKLAMHAFRMSRRNSLIILALCLCAIPFAAHIRRPVVAVLQILKGKQTVADRLNQYGHTVRARLAADFDRTGVSYPPKRITLVGLKAERTLEVWVSEDGSQWHLLKRYPIVAASGKLGPKTREGDNQVPEGIYRVESLNPNSLYHLALRVDYPNSFDRLMGERDERMNLGGDIMIHGSRYSIGCLAMGDPASEDLFVLAAESGADNLTVILAPVDFRRTDLPTGFSGAPAWTPQLYDQIRAALAPLTEADRRGAL